MIGAAVTEKQGGMITVAKISGFPLQEMLQKSLCLISYANL